MVYRSFILATRCLILLFTFIALLQQTIYSQESDQIALGTQHTIQSDTLNEERTYWVSLPDSYKEKGMAYKSYPILIVLDGHAHFKSVSGMVNYMSAGFNGNRQIPEMIVVAIKNVSRTRDFTPDKIVTKRKNDFGGGDRFLSFLENELIPQLDKDYRTSSYRILFGHSLGGLLATHAYLKEQTLFNAFIAVDPSFGSWDAPTMDKKLEAVTPSTFNRYIYFASANWGKRNHNNRHRHVRLYEKLNNKCEKEYPAELEYFENENHGSVPLVAFYNGMLSIFKGYGISYRDIKSMEQLESHYVEISERLSSTMVPPEALVNRLAYAKLRGKSDEDKNEALNLFKLNTENFPRSYNAFDSLGEAYEILGDTANAMINFKKSLVLNPNNANANTKLKTLGK